MAVADRGYVIRRGRVAFGGTAAELIARIDEVQASYLSSDMVDEPLARAGESV